MNTSNHFFSLRHLAFAGILTFTLASGALAQGVDDPEPPTSPQATREAVTVPAAEHTEKGSTPARKTQGARDSEAANELETPAKPTPGAKRDPLNTQTTPPAKGADVTPGDIDAITAYDAEKVIGNARPWQLYFQPAASPSMHEIERLHDGVLVLIVVISVFVLGLLVYVCTRFRERANPVPQTFTHNTKIEIIWTVIPILILVGIGIPSVRAHYAYTDNQTIPSQADMTLKVVGHQWYWSYEYPDEGIAFDSNIKKDDELENGEPRLLTVDNPIVVPIGKVVRVQMTSADVIHAWAVPSFGIKMDVVPGRLNETWFQADKIGIYYGQCSELCGKFHGFMPIELHVVSEEDYARWVAAAKLKFAASGSQQFAATSR